MTGRNTVNAMKIRKIPTARSAPKVTRDFPVGTLLVADCKFPGMSLTPFETTLKVPVTLSLAVLTAASRSKPRLEDSESSEAFEEAYAFQSASKDGDGFCRSLLVLGPPVNHACAVLCMFVSEEEVGAR